VFWQYNIVIATKELNMDYDVEYDSVLGCYCLHFAGEVVCLGAATHSQALEEALGIVEEWCE
jgi:hypothetical protein